MGNYRAGALGAASMKRGLIDLDASLNERSSVGESERAVAARALVRVRSCACVFVCMSAYAYACKCACAYICVRVLVRVHLRLRAHHMAPPCRQRTSMNCAFSMQPRHSAAASIPLSLNAFLICFIVHAS